MDIDRGIAVKGCIRSASLHRSMSAISDEFLAAIPKTDLHVHLDGSLRIATLIELARELNVELPSYDEAILRQSVFKAKYNTLEVNK
jgi:adenosine deaminase